MKCYEWHGIGPYDRFLSVEQEEVKNCNTDKTSSAKSPYHEDLFIVTPGVHYYLFDANYSIIMVTGDEEHWYKRDRINHKWIEDSDWSLIFYDLGFDKIEINYDEMHERILGRRNVPGFYSATVGPLFEFESDKD